MPVVADVRALIDGGETFTVEFKGEQRRALSDAELVEAVVCLANGAGGHLLVGVEDDGRVTGARPRHEGERTDPRRVEALIANLTQPPARADVELVPVDGRAVLVVVVEDSTRVVGTRRGLYVRRATGGDGRPSCVPFHAHEMLAHEIDRGAVDYAAVPVPGATWEDLDPLEFERLRRLVAESEGRGDRALAGLADREIAMALGVVADRAASVVYAGALLLFGREAALARFVQTHEAAFQVLRGTSVEVNDFHRWPLLRLAEEFVARFRARNSEEEIQFGMQRVPVPAYSEVAFREALANALIHRDYTQLGAVHVQWQDGDRLEVSNPGGLPPGVRVDNLLVVPPRPRNPRLADAFKRVGIVERTGRGVNRIFEEQLRYGRSAPDYSRTTSHTVVAALPGGPADLALVRWLAERDRAQQALSLDDLLVLTELLQERRMATVRAAQLLQRGEADVRGHLQRMVERGLVEARGEGQGRTWHLSAAVYRALEDAVAYVRVRGVEPLQQEQMILQFVDAHGAITRREAAELCQLGSKQASRLLQRLVRRGELAMYGERRGAYYERP